MIFAAIRDRLPKYSFGPAPIYSIELNYTVLAYRVYGRVSLILEGIMAEEELVFGPEFMGGG